MSNGDEDDEIDELREQTRGTDRISADAGDGTEDGEKDVEGQRGQEDTVHEDGESEEEQKAESPMPSEEFEIAFEERAGRTSSAIDPRTVSATDPDLSALLLALQDAGELEDVGRSVSEALGAREPPEYDRETVVRLAVAYALHETVPGYFEKLSERV